MSELQAAPHSTCPLLPSSLRLNLGCGSNRRPGYVNVDKCSSSSPDVVWDLETFPWPWDECSVGELVLHHVLEHLGPTAEVYLGVWKEMYRVCRSGADVRITVPHPRHDDFVTDPTHIRVIGPAGVWHFSKRQNRVWAERGIPNSPLALQLDVDFEPVDVFLDLDEPWASRLRGGQITRQQVSQAMRQFNNVVKQIRFHLKVIKAER